MITSRRGLLAGAFLMTTALALGACGGGDSADEGADAKTLTLWHYEGPTSAMGVAWNKAIEIFKTKHPGVEVKFEEKSFEQIQQNAQMILNSDSAPDILEYNKGNATAGLLSKQGLLTDLSDEVSKRGWDAKLSGSLQTTAKYDDDGIMGSGKFYGVPNYGEYVMVYYNKAMFDKYKIAVPTSLAEFTAAMDTFVKNKVTPLAVGGAEYPAQQIFYELALAKADRAFIDDYQLYKHKVDFNGPVLSYGASTFADWVKKGYLSKDSAGIKAEDMGVSWEQGKFPMLVSGSWWYGRFASEVKNFDWGTFLFPGNSLHPGSSGNLWVVPAKSKAKSLAYDFIDITMSPEVQNLLGNSGGVPVAADPAAITDAKNKELIANFNKLTSSDGLAFYPDWPAPGYYDVLVAGTQGLINGSKTPQAFLDEIAKPYTENLADLGK
ncbi:extracellular solute-binding protein [Actinoplanes oblitus]|uniref:Extracellular solute-binding protein n=1 Tax=Actinoplanes oblitus TaxID=3040509 RepID=A0ABY8WLP3_9ACTN|nr:extracellular solute-binding protein [Actinoplanes oblitus]WIM98814.1 extracellular solute-binding protein [Actinoplanes oblitus]